MKIKTRPCMKCGKASILEVKQEQFNRWRKGEHVQNVWPEWSSDERELLITGTHPECWKRMFGDDE